MTEQSTYCWADLDKAPPGSTGSTGLEPPVSWPSKAAKTWRKIRSTAPKRKKRGLPSVAEPSSTALTEEPLTRDPLKDARAILRHEGI